MKKTIFLLEDDPSMNRHLVNLLSEQWELEKYVIKGCSRIDLAIEYFEDHKDEIACIITDLNMDDEWLDEQYVEETQGGIFSGWVWLQHYVYTEKPDMPTIIYSGYAGGYLKPYLKDKNELDKLEKENISVIIKGSEKGQGFKGLFNALKKILKEGSENE